MDFGNFNILCVTVPLIVVLVVVYYFHTEQASAASGLVDKVKKIEEDVGKILKVIEEPVPDFGFSAPQFSTSPIMVDPTPLFSMRSTSRPARDVTEMYEEAGEQAAGDAAKTEDSSSLRKRATKKARGPDAPASASPDPVSQ